MKKSLKDFTKEEFELLMSTGLLWEFYPDAPDTYEKIHRKIDEFELLNSNEE